MADLVGSIGEVTMNIQVTRKETGETEDYVLTGIVTAENLEELENDGKSNDQILEQDK